MWLGPVGGSESVVVVEPVSCSCGPENWRVTCLGFQWNETRCSTPKPNDPVSDTTWVQSFLPELSWDKWKLTNVGGRQLIYVLITGEDTVQSSSPPPSLLHLPLSFAVSHTGLIIEFNLPPNVVTMIDCADMMEYFPSSLWINLCMDPHTHTH